MAAFDQTYFENSAASFYRDGYTRQMFLDHWEEKIPYLLHRARPRRALDIGCAKGFLVEQLRAHGVESFGVDISEYAINAAPDSVRPFLRQADICQQQLPFADGHFELVTCLELIEHLPEPELPLREIARILAPTGLAFFSTPSPDEEEEKQDVTHCSIFSFDQWTERFGRCGLRLERTPAWRLAGDRGRLGRLPRLVRDGLRRVYYPVRHGLLGDPNQHLFLEARRLA
jgi:SAM-dependent methyltransferase